MLLYQLMHFLSLHVFLFNFKAIKQLFTKFKLLNGGDC